jgi:hypothetical protein
MSEKIVSKSKSWYTYYQDRLEYYDSQQAALDAVDSIVASYEGWIWSSDTYLCLSYEQGVFVDYDLFDRRYSAKSLIFSKSDRRFRVDIYIKKKEDWIFKYGSELLQQSLRAGYDCNEGYLAERLARDYPGFTIKEWGKYQRVDTPNEKCLCACVEYEYAYCSIDKQDYYITIDNYLGKYQLVKFIDPHLEIARVTFPTEIRSSAIAVTDDKKEWILEYGSDLLQQSLMAGYDCGDRYLQERVAYEYPGFEINLRNYAKVNSPEESCLFACWGYEGSYCSSHNQNYYVTIDNFLGRYQLIKPINNSLKIASKNPIQIEILKSLEATIRRNETIVVVTLCSTFSLLLWLFSFLFSTRLIG